ILDPGDDRAVKASPAGGLPAGLDRPRSPRAREADLARSDTEDATNTTSLHQQQPRTNPLTTSTASDMPIHRTRYPALCATRAPGLASGQTLSAMVPETRYVSVGDADVAYQIVGQGRVDLVVFWGLGTQIDLEWDQPRSAAALNRLASFSRLIRF